MIGKRPPAPEVQVPVDVLEAVVAGVVPLVLPPTRTVAFSFTGSILAESRLGWTLAAQGRKRFCGLHAEAPNPQGTRAQPAPLSSPMCARTSRWP